MNDLYKKAYKHRKKKIEEIEDREEELLKKEEEQEQQNKNDYKKHLVKVIKEEDFYEYFNDINYCLRRRDDKTFYVFKAEFLRDYIQEMIKEELK